MKRIIITGVTGWLGSALINKLQGEENTEIIPIASSSREIMLESGKKIMAYSFQDALHNVTIMPQKNIPETHLWHLAFLTKDKLSMEFESYINANLQIHSNVEEIIKRFNVKKMVYASSGAVRNPDGTFASDVTDNSTNLYGAMKYQDELHFANLAKKEEMCLITPRIFSLLGGYINKHLLYAAANFINQANETGEIIIQAKSRVFRSYIGVHEVIDICQRFLHDIENKKSVFLFETGNVEVLELNDLALLVAKVLNKNVKIYREFHPNVNDNRYIGDISNQNILAEKYNIKLASHEENIQKTADFLLKK